MVGSASTIVASYYHPTAQRHPLPRLWPQGPMSWTPLASYTLVNTDCEYTHTKYLTLHHQNNTLLSHKHGHASHTHRFSLAH